MHIGQLIRKQIDGKEHLVPASTSAKEFSKQLGIAESGSKNLGKSFLDFNQKNRMASQHQRLHLPNGRQHAASGAGRTG